ncbi:MAG: hypothetical protein KGP12_02575 [Actinomycetales bacterium]|nr:hypothetical protein [Actinomycetales bacterium]
MAHLRLILRHAPLLAAIAVSGTLAITAGLQVLQVARAAELVQAQAHD